MLGRSESRYISLILLLINSIAKKRGITAGCALISFVRKGRVPLKPVVMAVNREIVPILPNCTALSMFQANVERNNVLVGVFGWPRNME